MTNKQLFIQKLGILLREKEDRIKLVLIGQEALEIFSNAQREPHENYNENILIDDMTRRIIDYARNPKDEKTIACHLTLMADLITN